MERASEGGSFGSAVMRIQQPQLTHARATALFILPFISLRHTLITDKPSLAGPHAPTTALPLYIHLITPLASSLINLSRTCLFDRAHAYAYASPHTCALSLSLSLSLHPTILVHYSYSSFHNSSSLDMLTH
jgi:hypothetical protein